MIRILKVTGLRLWLTTMAALPLGFWALPRVGAWFPNMSGPVILIGIYAGTGLGLGLMMDFMGTRRIRGLVREAALWEGTGIQSRAQANYLRAMTLFDSAWISPLAARGTGPLLIRALARFSLTSGSSHPGIRRAAALHIKANPGDKAMVRLWLAQLSSMELPGSGNNGHDSQGKENRSAGPRDGLTQAVLTILADTHFEDSELAGPLVEIFLDGGRVDYSARRLYASYLDGTGATAHPFRERILALLGPGEGLGRHSHIPSARERVEQGADDGGAVPGETLGRFRQNIPLAKAPEGSARIPNPFSKITGPAKGAVSRAARLASWARRLAGGLVRGRKREQLGLYLKGGFMGLLGIWLAFFAWTTLSHMFRSTDQPARRIEKRIEKPFTIQVAAYLKSSHARRYVAALKKKGIEATIKETGGGGKTWYLVRVSEFADKKRAAAHGNRLKAGKFIEDFFVSNK